MKFSINWAQHYSNIDLKTWSSDEVVSMIGSQLGAVEDVIKWGPRYDGIVVARIVSFKKQDSKLLAIASINLMQSWILFERN